MLYFLLNSHNRWFYYTDLLKQVIEMGTRGQTNTNTIILTHLRTVKISVSCKRKQANESVGHYFGMHNN